MGVIAALLGEHKNIIGWFLAHAVGGQCSNCKIHIVQGALALAKRGYTFALVEAALCDNL